MGLFNRTILGRSVKVGGKGWGKKEDLEREFDQLTVGPGGAQANYGDARTTAAIGYLGKAVLKLNRTSSWLAIVNIVLTAVILVVGLIQICLMLRGH